VLPAWGNSNCPFIYQYMWAGCVRSGRNTLKSHDPQLDLKWSTRRRRGIKVRAKVLVLRLNELRDFADSPVSQIEEEPGMSVNLHECLPTMKAPLDYVAL
jgi:hypothetical protein